MTNYAVEIALPDHVRGDRWPGIAAIGPVTIDGAAPTAPLARVRMHLRHWLLGRAVYRLDSDAAERDAPIVIDHAAQWRAHVPAVQQFVTLAGKWRWDMEFYGQGDSAPLTLYRGTLTVHDDVTQ